MGVFVGGSGVLVGTFAVFEGFGVFEANWDVFVAVGAVVLVGRGVFVGRGVLVGNKGCDWAVAEGVGVIVGTGVPPGCEVAVGRGVLDGVGVLVGALVLVGVTCEISGLPVGEGRGVVEDDNVPRAGGLPGSVGGEVGVSGVP